MSGWLVAVEGPSAAGKSRAVAAAGRSLGLRTIAEAYDRIRPRPSLTWETDAEWLRLERRLLREESRRYQEGRELADDGATVLTDTGFLGPLTYTLGLVRLGLASRSVLTELVRRGRELHEERAWGLPDAILYLRTTTAERRRRAALDPVGHPAALQARHQTIAADELRVYRTLVAPEFGGRLRFVLGIGGTEGVAARLEGALARTRVPHRRPSLERILRSLDGDRTRPSGVR
jgi:hypothetical protein